MHRLYSHPRIHPPHIYIWPVWSTEYIRPPRRTPSPFFILWFFLHNRQCSPNLCVVFSTAVSIYTNFPMPKQPPNRMLNQIHTSHIAKIRLTTHCISRRQHLKGVNVSWWQDVGSSMAICLTLYPSHELNSYTISGISWFFFSSLMNSAVDTVFWQYDEFVVGQMVVMWNHKLIQCDRKLLKFISIFW